MSDSLRLLITADLNQGLTVGALNNSIRAIEKSKSLKAIRLKIDVDQSILKALKEFNSNISKVNQTLNQQSNVQNKVANASKKSTDAINSETQALSKQNAELAKNGKLKSKVKTADNNIGGKDVTVSTTSGNQFGTKTESATYSYGPGELDPASKITHPIIETFDHARLQEAEKNLKNFTDNSNKRLKELRKSIGNFNPDIERLSKNVQGLNVHSSKTDFSHINDQIKLLEKYSKQEVKARQEVDKALLNIGKQARQEELDDIQKRADLSQQVRLAEYEKQMAMNRSRISDERRAWDDAYREKERRESHIHGKRVQDTYRAYDLAKKEDEVFNRRRQANEDKFALKQQDTLNKLAIARQKFGHHTQVAGRLDGIEAMVRDSNRFNASAKDWEVQAKRFNSEIAKSTAGFRAMRQESIGLIDGFKTAMVKFPIWIASATAIYAPIRGLQSAINLIYEVDSQMTQLRRVMNDSTNFEGMLQRSIELTKELGQSITTINNSMIEFARMGFDEQQTMALAKTATLAQNISELSSDEAVSAITSAMIIWNIEADKSISIIDKLNEINIFGLLLIAI